MRTSPRHEKSRQSTMQSLENVSIIKCNYTSGSCCSAGSVHDRTCQPLLPDALASRRFQPTYSSTIDLWLIATYMRFGGEFTCPTSLTTTLLHLCVPGSRQDDSRPEHILQGTMDPPLMARGAAKLSCDVISERSNQKKHTGLNVNMSSRVIVSALGAPPESFLRERKRKNLDPPAPRDNALLNPSIWTQHRTAF